MASDKVTFEQVSISFKENDKCFLEKVYKSLGGKLSSVRLVPPEEQFQLLDRVLYREFGAQPYVPQYLKEVKNVVTIA